MQTLSIISLIKNFNKQVLIDHLHFNHEKRKKEKLLNSLQEITIRPDNEFTMQCYNTVTELLCHVIIIMEFVFVR
jgi:hypothetical protein